MTVRKQVQITAEHFTTGQYDRAESYAREVPITVLEDGRVMIGTEMDGYAFKPGELQTALDYLMEPSYD